MAATRMCPSQQELSDYLLGRLDESVAGPISAHLQVCENCFARLDLVDDAHDPMVHRLRQPQPDDDFMCEPECQLAVANGLQLARLLVKDVEMLRDYQLIEKLGEGGMGTVYRARHANLDREVAVKLLPVGHLHREETVARFKREMKAIGRLDHPNIVRAHDAGEAEGRHFLVMELVNGLDLSVLVRRRGPLPVADACELIRQTALGLQHAHEHQLVHRDIKPSNLMLTSHGQVKVLDLGLARLQDPPAEGGEITSTGQIMGTLDYMAPEQLGESHLVDIRADIYSLGATLYKLLTGHSPHADTLSNTPQKKLMAIATKPVQPVAELRDDIPLGLSRVLDRMLAKEPDERFATPAEVAGVLEMYCQTADLPARFTEATEAGRAMEETETSGVSTFAPVASSFTDTHPSREQEQPVPAVIRGGDGWWRRNRVLVAAALLAFFGVVFSVFYVLNGKAILVVEVDDDAVAVELQKSGLTVKDRDTGREYKIRTPGEMELAAGNYELTVTDDAGLEVNTDRFTITRRGKEIVRISLRKDGAIAKDDAPGPREPVPPPGPPSPLPTGSNASSLPGAPAFQGGDPISPASIVAHPARLEGLDSWTLDTIRPRGVVHALAFQPNSHVLAMGGDDAMIRLLDVDSDQPPRLLVGHAARITCLAWSPDGTRIASGSDDQTVRIWDAHKCKLVAAPIPFTNPVIRIAWSERQELIAISTSDGVYVWDLSKSHRTDAFDLKPQVADVALEWSHDGQSLLACGPRIVKVWNGGTVVAEWNTIADTSDFWFRDAIWSDADAAVVLCGDRVGVGENTGRAWRWNWTTASFDAAAMESERELPGQFIRSHWSNRGDRLFLITSESNVQKLFISLDEHFSPHDEPRQLGGWLPPVSANCMAVSHDDHLCAVSDLNRNVFIVDLESTKTRTRDRQIVAHPEFSGTVFWSPNGRYVATMPHYRKSLNNVSIYEEQEWSLAWRADSWEDRVTFGYPSLFGWTPDSESFMRALGTTLELRHMNASHEARRYELGFSAMADDLFVDLATALSDGMVAMRNNMDTILLADVINGREAELSDTSGAVPYSSSSRMLLAAHNPRHFLRVWRLDHRVGGIDNIYDASWETAEVPLRSAAAFSPDDRWLAATRVSNDFPRHAACGLWDLEKKNLVQEFPLEAISLRFAEEGQTLLAVSPDGRLTEWETASGRPLRNVMLTTGIVLNVTWSPDNSQLLAVHADNTLRMFDVPTGQLQETIVGIEGPLGPVMRVSPDGHYRVTQPERMWQELVYVVQTAEGQQTLTPDEFSAKYGWKNDLEKAKIHLD